MHRRPENFMSDPTYDPVEIHANPIWRVAFVISECLNDKSPIGWSNYIWVSQAIIDGAMKKVLRLQTERNVL